MQRSRNRHIWAVLGPLTCLAAGLLLPAYLSKGMTVGILCVIAVTVVIALTRRRSNHVNAILSRTQKKTFSAMACGVAVLEPEGHIVWVNEPFARLIACEAQDLAGLPFSMLVGEEAWESVRQRQAELESPAPVQIAGGLARDDGDAAWVSGYASALETNDSYTVIQVVDLSEYRDSHASLLNTVSGFQQALEMSEDLVAMVDARGRITFVNPSAVDQLFIEGEPAGQNFLNFIHSEDRQRFANALQQLRAGDDPFELGALRLVTAHESAEIPCSARITRQLTTSDTVGAVVTCRPLEQAIASEKELRSSETRFSRIFHSSPDAILIIRNEDGTVLDFNAGFTQLLEYTREDAIGEPESTLDLWVHTVERERTLETLRSNRECTAIETKLRTRSGATVYVDISLRYIEIEGELCVLCIGRDVSKRALAEAALKESEHKFAQVFSHSPDGIVIIRQEDMTIFDINDAFVAESGWTREELVGASVADLGVFADESALPDAIRLLLEDGQFSNVEMMFRNKPGEEIPALVSATMLEVGEEPCVLCIAKDIRDLRSTEEQLRISEERFRGAFENAPIGILLLDMEGRIFQANRFAAELLDYESGSMRNLHISRLVPSEERSHYKARLQRLASGREDTPRIEQRMLCGSGLEIWTNLHIVLQRDREGAPSYCIVQIADITETKISQQQMERMAFYDILTDLANRRLFYDRLAQAIEHTQRNNRLAALLYLDLDQFKRVNDTLGHEAGDALLKSVADRLATAVRKEDTVGRPGGDEFTVLLYDIGSPTDASHVAGKILDVLRRPITISGQQLIVTTSIGITIIPSDGTDPKVLMKNADLAMYRAKEHGRNQFQFYSEEMNTNATNRLKTEYELRHALEHDEFELFFQPKVRLADQNIVGVECLLRWHHPERGLLLPGEFIGVAEETGAIVDIGKWIIEAACRAAKQLGDKHTPVCTAVNISSRQFRDPELVSTIRRCLRSSGVDPNHLELEITETMLMHDVEAASETVRQLHDLGVRLAIDDFGTGYSSLNYLKKFPIDTVKVDRSFVMDIPNSPDDMAITSAVIAMAHRLNMEVVAEGVETPEQLEFLQQHHCEYAQGFLFSKALPLPAVEQLLAPNVRLLRGR